MKNVQVAVQTPERSLFERVGGAPWVAWLVGRLYDRICDDEALAAALADVDVAALKRAQISFFVQALGGAAIDANPGGAELVLDFEGLTRVALHVRDTLRGLDLPDELRNELVLAFFTRALRP